MADRTRHLWTATMALGALLCAGAALALAAPAIGEGPASATTAAPVTTSAETVAVTSTSGVVTEAGPAPQSAAVEAGAIATPAAPPAPVPVPVSVQLTQAAAPIPVVPIGVTSGVLEPPSDIATVGWWVGGPRPGAAGRAIITGHVDSRAGLGAFAALDDLGVGDRIAVTGNDGSVTGYVVTDRTEIAKTRVDPAVFRGTSDADLLLVTCTGDFDPVARSYASNLLITAVVDGAPPDA